MCETLTSGGLLVEQLVVYETTESKHLKEDLSVIQPPDWVVLFSPSGARAALPLLQGFAKERPFKVVAIGEEAMWYGHHHPFSPRRNHKRGGVASGLRGRWSCFETFPRCLVFSAQRWNG